MNTKPSSLEFVRRDILNYLNTNGFASQEQIINQLMWPSVLVSSCIGFLIEDGLIDSKVVDGQVILSDAASLSH